MSRSGVQRAKRIGSDLGILTWERRFETKRGIWQERSCKYQLTLPSFPLKGIRKNTFNDWSRGIGKEGARRSQLKAMPYSEYLQSPEWAAIRDKAIRRAGHRCQLCAGRNFLQVHHNRYPPRGKEEPYDLAVLCLDCHKAFHECKPRSFFSYRGSSRAPAKGGGGITKEQHQARDHIET